MSNEQIHYELGQLKSIKDPIKRTIHKLQRAYLPHFMFRYHKFSNSNFCHELSTFGGYNN